MKYKHKAHTWASQIGDYDDGIYHNFSECEYCGARTEQYPRGDYSAMRLAEMSMHPYCGMSVFQKVQKIIKIILYK